MCDKDISQQPYHFEICDDVDFVGDMDIYMKEIIRKCVGEYLSVLESVSDNDNIVFHYPNDMNSLGEWIETLRRIYHGLGYDNKKLDKEARELFAKYWNYMWI